MTEPPDDLFDGGGETGRLMAGLDWPATPLGPVGGWPQSLKAAVRIVLSSRYPMLLLWGPNLTQLYNDAYSALIGDKHPAALGLDVRITLAEGWDVLGPLIGEAMATGVASWVPALRLLLERAGYREEAYFSVSHAPARDDSGVTVGVLTVCSEVTEQVVGERRLRLLRDLALPAGTGPAGVGDTAARLCEVIGGHPLDVPFAAVYLRDGGLLRRSALTGAPPDSLPDVITLDGPGETPDGSGRARDAPGRTPAGPGADPWRLRAAAGGEIAEMHDVGERLALPGGPWNDAVHTAVARPLHAAGRPQPLGVLLTGLSPSRALDETYRSFLQLLAQQVATAAGNAQAYQDERDRAAALAELDRVKTDFFTNVSHEFRTPLTLMLGPLADALADRGEPLGEAQRARVDTARRNASRLLTLVNELLTFTSIGTGEARTAPRTLDLALFTAELAGVFRAAVERTGLRLVVRCPPLPRPVAVDPGHWEKIVTNLISNALKFTFVGEIRVILESDASAIRLRVEDTGIGIDADEIPRLFDRFHRVRGVRSRSHEGTGIGLALVRELARLAGGDVEAAGAPGEGATFTVVLPWAAVEPSGTPEPETAPDRLADARAAATGADGWTGDPATGPAPSGPDATRILVADDNSDMRAYLTRLLTGEGWRVETAADGEAALTAIRRGRPDLLITDVMMPRLDGFALVRTLRADPATRSLPVVMLSARAGQESGVEGFAAGADDYIVKPFSARELLARVRNTLELASVRAAPAGQPAGHIGAAAVIVSARALEQAFQAATETARALLDGVAAVTVLDRPPLRFDSVAAPAEAGGAIVRSGIGGFGGARTGEITVRLRPGRRADGPASSVLNATAGLLAALAQGDWRPGHERQATLALQQSVSPDAVPAPDGWDLHPGYRPGSGPAGGTWHDVAGTPGGDLLVSVGVVAGSGPVAAVIAGQLRAAVRAHAAESPSGIVDRVAAAGVDATLLVVVIDPRTGRFVWCSAGHPAPILSAAGGPTRHLTGWPGPPPGPAVGSYRQNDGTLGPGDQLLLHTAGAAEDSSERLRRRCHAEFAAGATVSALTEAVLSVTSRPQHDDIAVVTVRRRPAVVATPVSRLPDLDVTWTYPLEPAAAGAARRALQRALPAGAVDPDLLYDLQVAATEAINNAVEHAQRPTRPEVRVRLRASDGLVRVEVQDFGGWRARPPARDRGRGAILMNAYGDVRVTATGTGTLVTIERRWTAPPA
ncbi:response regulator [Actinoplanes sp. NEAU-A12]|uniref:histidine kinase n=1 Tax=Actinoplanes sandaracinus TaxID=3045177 RepID=A0ABT6WSL7_9ACTN|nr:ATP-binding protein [Actinoplanes sandaracinus]MDI6102704.1 response regulator [Actinoplanes sandaracinus]